MNIVTGHRGFIGSHIYSRVRNPLGVEREDAFAFIEDFHDWKSVESVYHFGAITSTTETDVSLLYKYNVQFSIALFERCIQHSVPVRYASSASVYGNGYGNRKVNPLNQYAISKLTLDYHVKDNMTRFPLVQGFRLFNVYGIGEDHKGAQASPIHQFTQQAKTQGVIKVFRHSNRVERDFICVEDVCDRVIDCKHVSGIYDLGTSKPTSFLTVARLVQKKYGGDIVEIPFPAHLSGKYQYYTAANPDFAGPYRSVEHWLAQSNL